MRSSQEWLGEIRKRNELITRSGGSPLAAAKIAEAVIREAMEEAAADAFKRAAEKAAKLVAEGRAADEVKTEIESMK